MKLLLDTCIAGGTVIPLTADGHDEILARASREGRILITLDKDFGELAVVQEQAHAGIIRLVILSASQ